MSDEINVGRFKRALYSTPPEGVPDDREQEARDILNAWSKEHSKFKNPYIYTIGVAFVICWLAVTSNNDYVMAAGLVAVLVLHVSSFQYGKYCLQGTIEWRSLEYEIEIWEKAGRPAKQHWEQQV